VNTHSVVGRQEGHSACKSYVPAFQDPPQIIMTIHFIHPRSYAATKYLRLSKLVSEYESVSLIMRRFK